MKIPNNWHFTPALFVFVVACCQCSTLGTDDNEHRDTLFSQISRNPINFEHKQTAQGIPPPIANSAGPTFSSVPAFSPGSTPAYTKDDESDISDVIAENVLQFGHNIGLYLSELDPHATNSEIFSPLSVMSALSLLTLGARGKSYQELKQLLGFDRSAEVANNPGKYHEEFGALLDDVQHFTTNNANKLKPRRKQAKWRDTVMKSQKPGNVAHQSDVVDHTINVANGIFVQSGYSLNPDYSQIVKSIYDSEITQLDYQRKSREARDYINGWVSSSTHGKIPQIITDDIEKATNVILASVLYFKGFWETPFFPRSTNEDNFYPDGVHGTPIRVQMMATGGIFPYYDAKEYDCRIIGLPYRGNETTMYVIQPNDSNRHKLRDLQNLLNAQKINEMIDNMAWKTTIMVFPKMHFTRSMNMKKMLISMGVRDVFEGRYSDLSLVGGTRTAPAPIPLASVQQPTEERMQDVFGQGITTRSMHKPIKQQFFDRYHEPALIVTSRFGEEAALNNSSASTSETKTPSTTEETTMPSHHLNKRQIPANPSNMRNAEALESLERARAKSDSYVSDLFVGDILHKVDFTVDEYGTEAAAATLSYLLRSGTDVVFRGDTPFLVVIRHDPTKLPLFYGIINKPEL